MSSNAWTRVDSPAHHVFSTPIEKAELDDREYRVIRLENGLQALLIHDGTTDKAAAAMDVGVGHLSDPDDIPGLAHFCEHLLFLGTKAFPKENEYSQYIKAHGGSSNAYTSTSNTCYYFSVGSSHLAGALDRFSAFFHSPLFDPSCTVRELNAVNSEHKKNAQSDLHRIWQLFKSQAVPGHCWSKFGTGNLETLTQAAKAKTGESSMSDELDGGAVGRETRRRLIEWWERHYCASIMGLVVLGRESLDELATMTLERFSTVPNRGVPLPVETVPWGPEQQGKIMFVKTVMDVDTLELSFPLPRQDTLYESKPATFLSHFIGHEGDGSLFAYLKEKGWVTQLWSGPQSSARGFSFMKINVKLTKSGLKHYKQVLASIYSYLSLLRATSLPRWNFEEFKAIKDMQFRFAQKASPQSYVSRLSEYLSRPWPKERLLSGPTRLWKYDETLLRNMIEQLLAPEAGSAILSSKDFQGVDLDGPWLKEKWYGTEYFIQSLEEEVLAQARAPNSIDELFLPGPNKFVPQNFDVVRTQVTEPAKAPTLLLKSEGFELWHKKDDQFWLPKGYIGVYIRSSEAESSAKQFLMTKFIESLVPDALSKYTYDASLADLDYTLAFSGEGELLLQLNGYTDKLVPFLQYVLERFKNHKVAEDRFQVYHAELKQSYENAQKKEPYNLANDWVWYALRNVAYTNEELLAEFPHITAAQVQDHLTQLLSRARLTLVVNGNFEEKDALAAAEITRKTLGLRPLLPGEALNRTMILPIGQNFIHDHQLTNPKETNNAVEYYLQIQGDPEKVHPQLLLLAHLINEPAFSTLRTKEQLGYIVSSYSWPQVSVFGMVLQVQSEKPALYVENRIDAFLESYASTLREMDQKVFENQRQGLVNKLLEKLDNLDQETSRFAFRILDGTYDFTNREKNARRIENLTLADIIEFYTTFVHPESQSRAKLSVHMHSQVKLGKSSNFSVAASKVFLERLKEAQVPVDEPQYHALSKAEPSIDAVIGFWTPYLNSLPILTPQKREELLGSIKTIAAEHPTQVNKDVSGVMREGTVVVEDIAAFKRGLAVSKPAKPVMELKPVLESQPNPKL